MADKEEKNGSLDQNSNVNQQEPKKGENEDDSNIGFKEELEEMYDSRVFFKNQVNQIENRHVNLTLILTQFFCRYGFTQTVVFLSVATGIVYVQGKSLESGISASTALDAGILMTALMIVFLGLTLKNILFALADIKRIKRGFCTIGYQIVKRNENNGESAVDFSVPPLIAYKDYANMIRTMTITEELFKKYSLSPVLVLFLNDNNPFKVTIFEDMPRNISYEYKKQTFTQDWKELRYTVFPVAMIIIYAISAYMSCFAYTTLHQ